LKGLKELTEDTFKTVKHKTGWDTAFTSANLSCSTGRRMGWCPM
jgi:hypothetical protein